MGIPSRQLALFALFVVLAMALPASAAHGGGSGTSSSHGIGSGSAMPAFAGNGGVTIPGLPGEGPGGAGVKVQAFGDESRAAAGQGPGSFGGEGHAIKSPPGQDRSEGSKGRGEGVSLGGPGGVMAQGRIGAVQSPPMSETIPALPPGRHRGPPEPWQPYGAGTQAGRLPCGPAQTQAPLAGAPASDDPQPNPAGSPRARKDGDEEEPSPSPPDTAYTPLLFFPLLGFRRINAKNVLAHGLRERVYQAIAAHPGADSTTIAHLLETNPSTLRYHLFALLRARKITAFSRPGVVRYYQNQGMYPPFLQCLLHHLWTATPRQIIMLLWQSPGMTRAQLADALSCSGPSVTRHMQTMAEDGVVENRSQGRSNHYFLTPAAVDALLALGRITHAPALPSGTLPALSSTA